MSALIGRNLKLYFRDKMAVFFSLLSVIIVVVLYVLFLSQMQIDALDQASGGRIPDTMIKGVINSWILAGLLSITTVTSTLGGYGTMVNDREKQKLMDFKTSSMPQAAYPLSQFIAAFLIGTVISLIALVGYGCYIHFMGFYTFTWEQIARAVGDILLSSLMNAALMGFCVSLLKTASAYSNFCLVLGTIIGFLNGLYVPLGVLPKAVQTVIKVLPFGHLAMLFRQSLAADAAAEAFADLPAAALENYESTYGIVMDWNGNEITRGQSLLFIFIVFVVSLVLFAWNYNRKRAEL